MNQPAICFIRKLLSAAANTPLYGLEHPHVRHLLEEALLSLLEALKGKGEMAIDVIGSELVVDSLPQPFNIYLSRCAALLSSRGVARLRFTGGVDLDELTSLVTGLSLSSESGGRLASSPNIKLGRTDEAAELAKESRKGGGRTAAGSVLRELARQETAVWSGVQGVGSGTPLPMPELSDLVSRFLEAVRDLDGASVIAALLEESPFAHAGNVAILTIMLARALGVKPELLHDIGVAAMLHDIGKVFLPEEIRSQRKPGGADLTLLREHPIRGSRYLTGLPTVPRLAVVTAFEHHLKYDGTGYPAIMQSWRINTCSHLVMIADFFDARWGEFTASPEPALRAIAPVMMENAGAALHPFFTYTFLSMLYDSTGGKRVSP